METYRKVCADAERDTITSITKTATEATKQLEIAATDLKRNQDSALSSTGRTALTSFEQQLDTARTTRLGSFNTDVDTRVRTTLTALESTKTDITALDTAATARLRTLDTEAERFEKRIDSAATDRLSSFNTDANIRTTTLLQNLESAEREAAKRLTDRDASLRENFGIDSLPSRLEACEAMNTTLSNLLEEIENLKRVGNDAAIGTREVGHTATNGRDGDVTSTSLTSATTECAADTTGDDTTGVTSRASTGVDPPGHDGGGPTRDDAYSADGQRKRDSWPLQTRGGGTRNDSPMARDGTTGDDAHNIQVSDMGNDGHRTARNDQDLPGPSFDGAAREGNVTSQRNHDHTNRRSFGDVISEATPKHTFRGRNTAPVYDSPLLYSTKGL